MAMKEKRLRPASDRKRFIKSIFRRARAIGG
jgi:hypothetical protein